MWESLSGFPRGRISSRKFVTFFAAAIVASLGYILAGSTPVLAATDAKWDREKIIYEGDSYKPGNLPKQLDSQLGSAQTYQFITDKDRGIQEVEIIYFPEGVSPRSEGEAKYVRYTLRPPNSVSDPEGEKTITITPDPNGDPLAGANREDDSASGCTIDGIGWLVCPIMNGLAEGMDFIYEKIQGYLTVQPITTSVDNPIYRIWVYSRDLANIAFIIGFLVIIYSYLVGGGFNGYEIRKILPRLVIAAVLINLSYIICAVAVDISNIAGSSVNQLFETVRDEVLTGSRTTESVNWTSVTTWVLAGGAGAAAAGLVLPGATAGAVAGGLWFLLAPFLVGAALLVIVTFFILAARQAIIVVFIAIAPLAFAAFILPNTEKWFEKWRSVFVTMLVMFPAFGAVFGGAQLAGELIIRTASGIEQVILGLGVMVAPLAITPLLLKLGGGVLNRFGGIVNNANKGVFDRFKNYNSERRQDFLAKQNRKNAERDENGNLLLGKGQFIRRAAYRQNYKKYNRGRLREANAAATNAWYDDYDPGIETLGSRFGRRYADARGRGDEYTPSYKYGSAEIADIGHRTELLKGSTHARHDRHWQKEVATSPDLRARKVQTDVDTGIAGIYKGEVEAAGQQEFRQTVEGSRALSRVVKDTHNAKKQAEIYESIVQKAAEESWSNSVREDAAIQTIYNRSILAEDNANFADKQLQVFTQEVRSRGSEARGLAQGNTDVADSIRSNTVQIAAQDSALETLKEEQSSYVLKQLRDDRSIRMVAGAGTQLGATKVLAKAQSGITKQYLENVKAQTSVYSNDGYRVDEMLQAMQKDDYKLHDGTTVNPVAQHAAVQYVMEDIGNNWSVQKIIEWADTQGMQLIEGKDGEPDAYYDAAAYREAARSGNLKTFEHDNKLTPDEVADRRDLLQMVVGGYRNGKNKVSYFTNTLQEKVNRGLSISSYSNELGRDMTFAESAVLTEAKQQKYDPNRITNMDPDELARMAQLLRNPDYRKQLNKQQRDSIVNSIVQAQSGDQTRHLIKDRERGLMNIVASYLELPPDTNPPLDELRDIEQNYYYEEREDENGVKYSVRVSQGATGENIKVAKASVEVPNIYDYQRQVDQVSGTGLKPPRGGREEDFDINKVIK